MPAIERADRAVGAYLGLAVGDALGATVEFMTPREIRTVHGVRDCISGGGWLRLPKGQVTDDTTMALALGGAILEKGAVEAQAVAEAFSMWLRGKPVDVGNTVRRGIVHYRHTGETEVPENPYDAGNGACMRTLPVALATLGQSEEAVRAACRIQAHTTHNHPLSDAATETVVLMVQDVLCGADKLELLHGRAKELVDRQPEFAFRAKRTENPSAFVVETLRAVMQAVFDTENFRDCLVDVVNRGGDADTTGAIAGMIAGALYGPESIPKDWLQALNPDVVAACERQARDLLALSHSASSM